jgi:Ca2+-binding RTX toxin-like protein
MIPKYVPRLTLIILFMLIVLGTVNAIAASNTVPASHVDEDSFDIFPNDLKPADCTMNITNIRAGSGILFGTAANDLIMGTASGDIIFGLGGNDCIVGGAGNDLILGGAGTDICFGGEGSDSLGCEETPDLEPGE